MKKYLFALLTLLNSGAVFGATGESCKNFLVSKLTTTLQSSNINLSSKTLERDVQALLLPQLAEIIEHNAECASVKKDLLKYDGTSFSVNHNNHRFDISLDFTGTLVGTLNPVDIPDELESVLSWYGILIVQKGSLDNYANSDTPIISTEYMKQNKDRFFPKNSDKLMGMARACTHGNHMAHDKDVVNRAAHITAGEQDSFWTGNDYYVYDGEDVYWGWASLAGEVALALVTLGLSAEVQAASASVQAANVAVQGASKSVAAAKLVKDASKLTKAAAVAKKAKAGSSAAAAASRADAVKALADAGITVKKGVRASELVKIGTTLENASAGIKTVKWASTLGHPWKLVKPGLTTLNPRNAARVYGKGVTWGQRIKRGAIQSAVAAAGVGTAAATTTGTPAFLVELAKAFGYSSASYKLPDNIKFNAFGLLSADDLEGRENEVSHGAWLQFDENGEISENDALNEALRFAEELADDIKSVNDKDPLCQGLDIYVVQPGISNPAKLKNREVYYIIQNPAGSIRVE